MHVMQKLRKNYAKITQKLRKNYAKKNYAKITHTCVNCIICIIMHPPHCWWPAPRARARGCSGSRKGVFCSRLGSLYSIKRNLKGILFRLLSLLGIRMAPSQAPGRVEPETVTVRAALATQLEAQAAVMVEVYPFLITRPWIGYIIIESSSSGRAARECIWFWARPGPASGLGRSFP